MRRNRITSFQPVTRLSGVTVRVMQMNRSVQTPVSFVTSLRGFALRFPVSAAHVKHTAGPRQARKTIGLTTKRIAEL